MQTIPSKLISAILTLSAVLVLALVQASGHAGASPTSSTIAAPLAAPVITYQGRLLDPTTGTAKTDGSYPMAFSLYAADTGGAPLWSESKSVVVSKGLFSTLLGDTTLLNPATFNSQALWLGIAVGGDPEMTPRQRIGYAAYAMHALNADTVDGQDAAAFAPASHSHAEFSRLPIAMGFVLDFASNTNPPSIETGTGNFSVVYNAAQGWYEITITNESYFFRRYVTLLTPTDSNVTIREGSGGGKLNVQIRNSAGNPVQGSFQFITYKP